MRAVVGVAAELGIFVQMHRRTASKKDVFWKYVIRGAPADVDNYLDHNDDAATYPTVRPLALSKIGAQRLAAIADTSKGIPDVRTVNLS